MSESIDQCVKLLLHAGAAPRPKERIGRATPKSTQLCREKSEYDKACDKIFEKVARG